MCYQSFKSGWRANLWDGAPKFKNLIRKIHNLGFSQNYPIEKLRKNFHKIWYLRWVCVCVRVSMFVSQGTTRSFWPECSLRRFNCWFTICNWELCTSLDILLELVIVSVDHVAYDFIKSGNLVLVYFFLPTWMLPAFERFNCI